MAPVKRAPFTPRRRAAVAFFLILLVVLGWLHFSGAAATRGLDRRDMDWNRDGTTTMQEMLQSLYAVKVVTTTEGARECRAFSWRGDDKVFRVDCRTVVKPDKE